MCVCVLSVSAHLCGRIFGLRFPRDLVFYNPLQVLFRMLRSCSEIIITEKNIEEKRLQTCKQTSEILSRCVAFSQKLVSQNTDLFIFAKRSTSTSQLMLKQMFDGNQTSVFNIIQHRATWWSNDSNIFDSTMSDDVASARCIRLAGPI